MKLNLVEDQMRQYQNVVDELVLTRIKCVWLIAENTRLKSLLTSTKRLPGEVK